MIRKTVLITIFAISLIGCDSDFSQGSCEEGFYQQSDGNGGFFCAPIGDEGFIDEPNTNVYETDKNNRDSKNIP